MQCYFHLCNGSERIIDLEGIEVADVDEARAQAQESVLEVLREGEVEISTWQGWFIEVSEVTGTVICRIDLSASESGFERDQPKSEQES